MESALTWTAWVDLSKSAKLGKPLRLVGCPRGVPVNKTGVPLVGNVDPAAVAANFKKDTFGAKSEEKKGKKKEPLVMLGFIVDLMGFIVDIMGFIVDLMGF